MTLSEAIHQRWAADEHLVALLPPERFVTGLGTDARLPYGVLNTAAVAPTVRYNDRSGIDTVTLRVDCFHQQYQQAAAVADRIRAVFDGAAMPLADGSEALLRFVGCHLRQEEQGAWHLRAKLECWLYRPAPAV
jgi:hypothetical protein